MGWGVGKGSPTHRNNKYCRHYWPQTPTQVHRRAVSELAAEVPKLHATDTNMWMCTSFAKRAADRWGSCFVSESNPRSANDQFSSPPRNSPGVHSSSERQGGHRASPCCHQSTPRTLGLQRPQSMPLAPLPARTGRPVKQGQPTRMMYPSKRLARHAKGPPSPSPALVDPNHCIVIRTMTAPRSERAPGRLPRLEKKEKENGEKK